MTTREEAIETVRRLLDRQHVLLTEYRFANELEKKRLELRLDAVDDALDAIRIKYPDIRLDEVITAE